MNCKQIYIKDKQIKYYWKNTHKVEDNDLKQSLGHSHFLQDQSGVT
jgi:hypothetical protein